MTEAEGILAQLHQDSRNLLDFLESIEGGEGTDLRVGDPVVLPRPGSPERLSKVRDELLVEPTAYRALRQTLAAAERDIYFRGALRILGIDADLASRMRGLVVEFVGKRFPRTGQVLGPLPLGERALACLVVAYNLVCREASRSASYRRQTWPRGGIDRTALRQALPQAYTLLASVDWARPPDPSPEGIFLAALLDPLLPLGAVGMASTSFGAWLGRPDWPQLWKELIIRSPLTAILLSGDASRGARTRSSPVKGDPDDQERFRSGAPAAERARAGPLGEEADLATELDLVHGLGPDACLVLRAVARRPDFDARGPLLRDLLARLTRQTPPDTAIEAPIQDVLESLGLSVLRARANAAPTIRDLERMLIEGP